jgi:hypothetical protein
MTPKTKKISLKKATKVETSEWANARLKTLAPKPLAHSECELGGSPGPKGRYQGHGPRPLGAGRGTRGRIRNNRVIE